MGNEKNLHRVIINWYNTDSSVISSGGVTMNCIVVVDDKNGMLFNHRRQSQDRKLREYILEMCGDEKIRMNQYSAKQFQEQDRSRITIEEDFLEHAEDGYCFVEDNAFAPYADKIHTLIICKWNRIYPSDFKLDIDISKGWIWKDTTEIVGNSHDKIRIEEWEKV